MCPREKFCLCVGTCVGAFGLCFGFCIKPIIMLFIIKTDPVRSTKERNVRCNKVYSVNTQMNTQSALTSFARVLGKSRN